MEHIRALTIPNVLRQMAQERGEKTFLHYLPTGETFTFRRVNELANSVANELLALDVAKGTHVASLMENSPEQALLYFALGKIGAVSIPINIAARGSFLEYFLNQSDARVLVADRTFLPVIEEVLANNEIQLLILLGDEKEHASTQVRTVDFERLRHGSQAEPAVDVRFSDLALITYTSGTTGPSKGNMYTQAGALTFGGNVVKTTGATEDDIYYVCFPLFHAAAWSSATLAMLQIGGGIALTRRFSAGRFLEDARAGRATIFNLLSVGPFLLAQPPSASDRDHCLKVGIAAPMPGEAEEFERRFGVRLIGAYGISDYAGAFAVTPEMSALKRTSVGPPFPDIRCRIVDDDDFEVPVNQIGELLLRHEHPWVAGMGYYNMPEATLHANRNNWFHTGDLFRKDEDGYFYFVDRKKDALRRRGENISTYEVEQAILALEGVAEVAVYAVKAETGEDDVGASIVLLSPSSLSESDIIRHCERNMPGFMVPRYLHVTDSLPKTITLKVKKEEIRQYVGSNLSSIWDRERALPVS